MEIYPVVFGNGLPFPLFPPTHPLSLYIFWSLEKSRFSFLKFVYENALDFSLWSNTNLSLLFPFPPFFSKPAPSCIIPSVRFSSVDLSLQRNESELAAGIIVLCFALACVLYLLNILLFVTIHQSRKAAVASTPLHVSDFASSAQSSEFLKCLCGFPSAMLSVSLHSGVHSSAMVPASLWQQTNCVLHLRAYFAALPTNPPECTHRV